MSDELEDLHEEVKPHTEAPAPTVDGVFDAIVVACTGKYFKGGTPENGVVPLELRAVGIKATNTLANIKAITRVYKNKPQFRPSQVPVMDSLNFWQLQELATAMEPLTGLIGYKFEGGLWTSYVFAGSFGDMLICVYGSVPPG